MRNLPVSVFSGYEAPGTKLPPFPLLATFSRHCPTMPAPVQLNHVEKGFSMAVRLMLRTRLIRASAVRI
jgi:hypothetical protein